MGYFIRKYEQARSRISPKKRFRAQRISVSLPFGLGGFTFEPNIAERRAAWALYVELSTRVASRPFSYEFGLMRGVLDSLYTLFGITRQVLKDAGPEIAESHDSLGFLAIQILNEGIAPFTNKWHHRLASHEQHRPEGKTPLAHERDWEFFEEMHGDLTKLQTGVQQYREALAKIAGVNEK